ncbi:uncharacterized protein LOC107458338 [Arachis duranensis]|uniref:Uncharacterized protein LOC107458338 n=1 Tax=Arachis duranensis TaxID=130453 RepID=A0A9C6TEE8_ARADU|nr:uncharacterized protein LOC107458338 [Arachis duranensis]
MDKDARMQETVDLKNNVELVRSVSDKLLRPSARNYSIFRGQAIDAAGHGKGKYSLIRDTEDYQTGLYDKPLPFFGCGVGWFSFLFGFLCPPMWFYASYLFVCLFHADIAYYCISMHRSIADNSSHSYAKMVVLPGVN